MVKLNRENLLALAEYLEKLPENYEHFTMSTFSNDGKIPYLVQNDCGTAACAIGHAPMTGVCPPLDNEQWFEYSDRFTFADDANSVDSPAHSCVWDWLYSDRWTEFDNTPAGAAKRIRTLLHDMNECIKHSKSLDNGTYDGYYDDFMMNTVKNYMERNYA